MSIFDKKIDQKPAEIEREAAFWKEFNKQSEDIAAIERELTDITKKLARIERKVYRTNVQEELPEPKPDNNWWTKLK